MDKDTQQRISALVKSSSYAYDVPLVTGVNVVNMEVSATEWCPESLVSDQSDQQVPPAQSIDGSADAVSPAQKKPEVKQYFLFITRS
ncbi:hypothetical protein EC988_008635 [Linderina pennispora]|nr:hypothetical protein EC988_008635 [Linderina pennispora]